MHHMMMVSPAAGGGDVSGGHKYWRVVGITFAGAKFGLSAMAFRDDVGASVSTSGQTVIESNHFGSNDASMLFDGNDSTFWEVTPAGTDTAWAGIQFTFKQKIRQVMLQRTASMDLTSPPAEVVVQWSDDGLVWGTACWIIVGTLVNDTPTWFDFTNVFPTSPRTDFGSHAYWRMHDVAANGNVWTALSAMLFKDSGGSAIATTGGTALESGHFSTFDSSALFDSNDATFWESSNIGYNSWAGYHFSSGKTVMQIGLQRHASMDGSNPPDRCRFEFSDDGSTWGIAASVEVGSLTNDVPTYFDLTGGL